MQHISKSFCYKSYRNTLAEDLIETRLKSKVKANNSLNIEKETIKYQVAKLIKKSVFQELKTKNEKTYFELLSEQNKLIEDEEKLIQKIIDNPEVFDRLDDRVKYNENFLIKLFNNEHPKLSRFYYNNFIKFNKLLPKHFYENKEFIIKVMNMHSDILLNIDKKLLKDCDIIKKANENWLSSTTLNCINICNKSRKKNI